MGRSWSVLIAPRSGRPARPDRRGRYLTSNIRSISRAVAVLFALLTTCSVANSAEGCDQGHVAQEKHYRAECERDLALESWGAASSDCRSEADQWHFVSILCDDDEFSKAQSHEIEADALVKTATALSYFDPERASATLLYARKMMNADAFSKLFVVRSEARDWLKHNPKSPHDLDGIATPFPGK